MKMFFVWLAPFVAQPAGAQTNGNATGILKEGTVVYEHVIKLEGPFKGPENEPMEKMPQQVTERFELLFGNNQSLWQPLPDAAAEAATLSGNEANTLRPARWTGSADVAYHHFEKGLRITQSELGPRTYIVEDSLSKPAWKVSGETKEILGYPAKKATAFRYGTRTVMGMENGVMKMQEQPDTVVLTAWFVPEIPVPAGPADGMLLPGLVLELSENKGRNVYKAIRLSPTVNVARIHAPKNGKRVSAAAFRTEQQKQLAEMRKRMQEGGRISMPLPPGN